MRKEQQKVREFMEKIPQTINNHPTIPSDEDRIRRVKLLFEEVLEFAHANGVEVKVGVFTMNKKMDNMDFKANGSVDLVEVADAIADIEYINLGSANTFGIDLKEIFQEVHKSNMKKFTGDAHKNSDGKWIKPSNWKAPNIKKILDKQKRPKK